MVGISPLSKATGGRLSFPSFLTSPTLRNKDKLRAPVWFLSLSSSQVPLPGYLLMPDTGAFLWTQKKEQFRDQVLTCPALRKQDDSFQEVISE